MTARASERWAAFLRQIEERHRAISEEAASAAREALPACQFDPVPIATAWAAVTQRLRELEQRISETWDERVEPALEAEGHGPAFVDQERAKGEDLTFLLENRRELGEAQVFANAARELYAVCVATQKERTCPNCGAAFAPRLAYRAQNLRCAHCGGVSTFEPGTLARNVVAFGAHPLATEAAAHEWLRMREAERNLHAARSPTPLALLKAYERAQIAYWTKYISVKAMLVPELSDVALEVRSRMDAWYRLSAEFEPSWVQAGRPRDALEP